MKLITYSTMCHNPGIQRYFLNTITNIKITNHLHSTIELKKKDPAHYNDNSRSPCINTRRASVNSFQAWKMWIVG
jgi:hypothetical protein